MTHLLNGLVAATHTPFKKDGSLNLDGIEKIAAHLSSNRLISHSSGVALVKVIP